MTEQTSKIDIKFSYMAKRNISYMANYPINSSVQFNLFVEGISQLVLLIVTVTFH